MGTPPIDAERARRYRAAIEGALRDGFDPYRVAGAGRGSSVQEAARRLRAAAVAETPDDRVALAAANLIEKLDTAFAD